MERPTCRILPSSRSSASAASRIFSFERPDETRVYIGSADLMPRNLDTRVELLAPVRDPALSADLTDALDRCMADDTNAWELREDGSWERREVIGEPRSVQRELIERHLRFTGSTLALAVLDDWDRARAKFVRVFPNEYKRALTEMHARQSVKPAAAKERAAA